uniref:Uncharacterized protein n=1 Tax=Parascaris univalens TaxID=6257 RepID=A0A915A1Q2_PARUN
DKCCVFCAKKLCVPIFFPFSFAEAIFYRFVANISSCKDSPYVAQKFQVTNTLGTLIHISRKMNIGCTVYGWFQASDTPQTVRQLAQKNLPQQVRPTKQVSSQATNHRDKFNNKAASKDSRSMRIYAQIYLRT